MWRERERRSAALFRVEKKEVSGTDERERGGQQHCGERERERARRSAALRRESEEVSSTVERERGGQQHCGERERARRSLAMSKIRTHHICIEL